MDLYSAESIIYPWDFTKEQRADLHVVGRVVWAGKKF